MSTMWVADDGSYGTGMIVTVDTTNWTDSDWEKFEEAPDHIRIYEASALEREKGSSKGVAR